MTSHEETLRKTGELLARLRQAKAQHEERERTARRDDQNQHDAIMRAHWRARPWHQKLRYWVLGVGGLRGLALALVILAAFPAFFAALWLRNRGEELVGDETSRRYGWVRVAIGLLAGLFIAKGIWNMWNDPPGMVRPCLFCTPYGSPALPPELTW